MRISLLGDLHSGTGMGNANREMRKSLQQFYEVRYSGKLRIVQRTLELFPLIRNCDVLVICTSTPFNYAAVIPAEILGRRIVYFMHGLASFEERLEHPEQNGAKLNAIHRYEHFILGHSDRIVCVSELFMNRIKERFPNCTEKMDYIWNVVDTERCEKIRRKGNGPVPGTVLSTGGGRKQKNINTVASALEESGGDFVLHVAGEEFSEGARIRRHRNVVWHGCLSHDDTLALMAATSVYVQNSSFETFGIALVEALFCGCSILVSENTGCLSLFRDLREEDLIRDVQDREEIGRKVRYLMTHPNNERLRKGFDKEAVTTRYQAERLKAIIEATAECR